MDSLVLIKMSVKIYLLNKIYEKTFVFGFRIFKHQYLKKKDQFHRKYKTVLKLYFLSCYKNI